MRIVSLLPSATEIVCLLGLEESLVGVSHECDFPPSVRRLPQVVRSSFDPEGLSQAEIDEKVREALRSGAGVYEIDRDLLASLSPDLILTQELCEVCAVSQATTAAAVEKLARPPRVLSLHAHALGDVLLDIRRIGEATATTERADRRIAELSERLRQVDEAVGRVSRRPRVAALEWLDPVMASGHWVGEMIRRAGGEDLLGRDREPSAVISWDDVLRYAP